MALPIELQRQKTTEIFVDISLIALLAVYSVVLLGQKINLARIAYDAIIIASTLSIAFIPVIQRSESSCFS